MVSHSCLQISWGYIANKSFAGTSHPIKTLVANSWSSVAVRHQILGCFHRLEIHRSEKSSHKNLCFVTNRPRDCAGPRCAKCHKTPFTKKKSLKNVAEDGPNRISPRHFVGAKGLNSKTDMGSERAPLNKPGFC